MTQHTVPFDRLRPNPRNPRRITDVKAKMLMAALARFGDLGGIVFNTRSQTLIGGHQRTAAWGGGIGSVTITDTFDPPTPVGTVRSGYIEAHGERFAYREVDWDEGIEIAANIAANKGAGEFAIPELQELMHELDGINFDMDLTLFDDREREALMGGAPGTVDERDLPTGDDYRISITCRDADHQAELMQRFEDEGLAVKASMG